MTVVVLVSASKVTKAFSDQYSVPGYAVFTLARMREEAAHTRSAETAVRNGIDRSGRLVTSMTLILFLGFVAMARAVARLLRTPVHAVSELEGSKP